MRGLFNQAIRVRARKLAINFTLRDSFSAVFLIHRSVHSHLHRPSPVTATSSSLVAHRAPPDDHHRPPGVLLSRRAVSRRRGLCAAPVAACSPSAEHPATSRHGAEHHRSPSPSGSRAPRFVKRKLRCDDSEGHGNQRRQRPRDQSLEQPSTAFGKDSEAVAGGPGSAHPLRGFARLVLRPSRRPREFLPESFAAACRAGGAKPAKGTFSARDAFLRSRVRFARRKLRSS